MSTSITDSNTNHQNKHDLAQRNAAHFDAIVHEHAHNHNVKQLASNLAEKIVQLLEIRPQEEQAHDDDHNDDHNDDDGSSKGITVLDYACGAGQSPYHPPPALLISIPIRFLKLTPYPGAMTWALFDKLDGNWKQFVGVDISQKSVDLYNQKAATQFAPEEMQAVCTELNGHPGELSGSTFDVIVVRAPPSYFLAPIYQILMSSSFSYSYSLSFFPFFWVLLSQSARKPTTTLQT